MRSKPALVDNNRYTDEDNLRHAGMLEVFMQQQARLKRIIAGMGLGANDAEDILQDAFIKLWDHCNNVNPEKAKSFLFTVAKNMFFNYKKHEKVVMNHQKRTLKSSNYETPEYLLVEKEFLVKILKVLQHLVC